MTQITLLADHPEWIPTITRWHWDEWGHHTPESSLEIWIEKMARRANRDRIPITLVAENDDRPVGTASIVRYDMKTHMHLTPWLGGVFVPPEFRGRGIGAAVVRAVEDAAKNLGIEQLYLYTSSAERLYLKLGWGEIERCEYDGREVAVMAKVIDS